MPRGRQYYDPIIQVPSMVGDTQDLSRIEFYLDEDLKWRGRLIAPDGSVAAVAPGDFDHDGALEQARRLWGDTLSVYELTGPQVDSTWNGQGPSPRLWQQPGQRQEERQEMEVEEVPEVAAAVPEEAPSLQCITIQEPGVFVRVDELCALLSHWASQYEEDRNPSAAIALRDAASALQEIQ